MTQHTPGTLDIVDLSQPDKRVVPTLAHDLPLGDPTRPVGERAGVANLEAVKGLIGGFAPVTLGKATVSAQLTTWRPTNLVISSTGKWFLLVVDLPAHRGTYLISGDQWRRLSSASPGGTPDPSEAIPLVGGVACGRAGGDALLISYAQAQSGMGSYDVELFQL